MSDEPAPTGLAAALAKLQGQLPHITKDATGQAGNRPIRYADLADVTTKIMPLLSACGLAFIAKPTVLPEGQFVLSYALMHGPTGEAERGLYPLPTGGGPQALGSAITYARRYCLCAVTGVAPEDDDDDARAAEDSPGPGAGRHGTGEPGPGRTTRPPTDVPTGQRPGRAKTTGPEHERLREGAVTGAVAGATRTRKQPADSQWHTGATEDKPGTLFDSQRSHIMARLGKMTRENRLARVSQLVGRTVESVNDLSITEAQRVISRLETAGE